VITGKSLRYAGPVSERASGQWQRAKHAPGAKTPLEGNHNSGPAKAAKITCGGGSVLAAHRRLTLSPKQITPTRTGHTATRSGPRPRSKGCPHSCPHNQYKLPSELYAFDGGALRYTSTSFLWGDQHDDFCAHPAMKGIAR
jgi:hypothetical protein